MRFLNMDISSITEYTALFIYQLFTIRKPFSLTKWSFLVDIKNTSIPDVAVPINTFAAWNDMKEQLLSEENENGEIRHLRLATHAVGIKKLKPT